MSPRCCPSVISLRSRRRCPAERAVADVAPGRVRVGDGCGPLHGPDDVASGRDVMRTTFWVLAAASVFGPRLATEAARRGALEVDRWEGSVTRRGLAILHPA